MGWASASCLGTEAVLLGAGSRRSGLSLIWKVWGSTRTPLHSLSQAGKLEAWVWAAVVGGGGSSLFSEILYFSFPQPWGMACFADDAGFPAPGPVCRLGSDVIPSSSQLWLLGTGHRAACLSQAGVSPRAESPSGAPQSSLKHLPCTSPPSASPPTTLGAGIPTHCFRMKKPYQTGEASA